MAIPTNEILAVIDREARLLDEDNWHAAAAMDAMLDGDCRRCLAKIGLNAEPSHRSSHWASGQISGHSVRFTR